MITLSLNCKLCEYETKAHSSIFMKQWENSNFRLRSYVFQIYAPISSKLQHPFWAFELLRIGSFKSKNHTIQFLTIPSKMLLKFCSPRHWSHSPGNESHFFAFELLHTKYNLQQPRVFCWKDLTRPIQILHPNQARFKIAHPREGLLCQIPYTPGTNGSQMPGDCPGEEDFEDLNWSAHYQQWLLNGRWKTVIVL